MAEESSPDNVTPLRPGPFTGRSGGSGPTDPGVEARLARLEAAVDALRVDMARIDGKISNLPTTFQLEFILAAFVVTIFAAALGLLKLSSLH